MAHNHGNHALAERDKSGVIAIQSVVITILVLLTYTLLSAFSWQVSVHLIPQGRWNRWYDVAGWLVILMLHTGIGYFTGRFAARKARLIGITTACVLFNIATTGYYVWLLHHYSPTSLYFKQPIFWVQNIAALITAVVTPIAIAEIVARRKPRNQTALDR